MTDTRSYAVPTAAKIVIAGGFGVGKTTFVTAVSDIGVVTTETAFSAASRSVDDLSAVPAKATTTVAMDFGRVDLDAELSLYLFGTPGQKRFWFMWDTLVRGALGAVVLADTRRLADCFGALDYFEAQQVPHMVVINQFDGAASYTETALREALAIRDVVPVMVCDARERAGVKNVLIALVEHLIRVRDSHRPVAAV